MANDPFFGRSHLSEGEMASDLAGQRLKNANPSTGWGQWSLASAVVEFVDYKALKVDITILTGEDGAPYNYRGIDLTFPSAGRRTFFGALPDVGDLCVVGWAIQESSGTGSSRQPVILRWLPSAPWMGYEWTPFQSLAPSEGLDSPKDREVYKSSLQRTRFKLRTMAPGSVLASSSQGSDLVLDESAVLFNRRGNEIRLRDQDQALVTRSVNQFHNSAGTRVYSGMVQRDARLLPTQVFSDGLNWASPNQVLPNGGILTEGYLFENSTTTEVAPYPSGFLTPAQIFRRSPDDVSNSDFESEAQFNFRSDFDPFDFLQRGSFVDSNGFKNSTDTFFELSVGKGVYGGKPVFRVGFPLDEIAKPSQVINAAVPNGREIAPDGLTEYRIEVAHTTDGTLPVTEQTDGFDSDRLPPQENALSLGAPFIEFVLGSVVGNDPFGNPTLYGLPIRPTIFADSDKRKSAPSLGSALNSPIGEHAATLFKVQPPANETTAPPVFWSVTKGGKMMFSASSPDRYSIEGFASNGLRFDSGGDIDISSTQSVSIEAGSSNRDFALDLTSPTGAVRIFGGARTNQGRFAADAAPDNAVSLPSVLIEGQSIALRSSDRLSLNAPSLSFGNSSQMEFKTQNALNLSSGENISLTTKISDQTFLGKLSLLVSGPPDFNIANAPTGVLTTTIAANPTTGFPGAGPVESKTVLMGDELETVGLVGPSNYLKTYVTSGIHEVGTNAGNIGFRATTNRVDINSVTGVAVTATTGAAAITAASGPALISAATNASIVAPAVTVTAATITLGSPGVSVGPIMCGSDRDPLTGIPYSALGLIPRGQNLSPA